jgi:hypothetical protein
MKIGSDMERFKQLLSEISQIKPLASNGETVCWEAYNASGSLIGYAFAADVPETVAGIPGADEMDRYQVFGILDPKEYRIVNLDITIHPELTKEPWTMEVTEPGFEKQFAGLTVKEIELSPEGKIDAISEATLSSTWITGAIRDKVEEIIKKAKK